MGKISEIAEWFVKNIRTSPFYNTPKPCKDESLLFPEFKEKIVEMVAAYLEEHETTPYVLETYRSNDLQLLYFNRGASKIRKNGMHHYGIAVDLVGLVDGHVNYEILDYEWLRVWARKNGLTVLNWELAHFQYIPVSEQQALRDEVSKFI